MGEPAGAASGEDDAEGASGQAARDPGDRRRASPGVEVVMRPRRHGVEQRLDPCPRKVVREDEVDVLGSHIRQGGVVRDEEDAAIGLPRAELLPLLVAHTREHHERVLALRPVERGNAIGAALLGRQERDAAKAPKGGGQVSRKRDGGRGRPESADRDHARPDARREELSARLEL